MQRIRPVALAALLLPFTLANCGGEGSVSPFANTDDSTPQAGSSTGESSLPIGAVNSGNGDTGNAATIDTVEVDPAPAEPDPAPVVPEPDVAVTSIDGRVADGYLQGATICVDLNENDSCDEDEPQTVSGEGGTYSLLVPDEATGKPIVADIPAEAIDEDTGEPIGKKLTFSTPGDKPSFVSPITTLVHQELKNNPALDVDDAEATVLETLGMPEDDTASLFTDYVAASDSDEQSERDKFLYLHQTARVVASMLDDIRENVETSAAENGIDLIGDEEARKAVRQLVHEEMRSLLPEISEAVATRISEIRESADTDVKLTDAFDPQEVADVFKSDEVKGSVAEQIEEIKNERPLEQVTMKDLLAEGMYMLDVDCHHEDNYGSDDGLEQSSVDAVGMIMNDEGSLEYSELPEYCYASYSKVKLNDDGSLDMHDYIFDRGAGAWVTDDDIYYDEDPHQYVLSDGMWKPAVGDDSLELVEFTDDGGAVLSTSAGKLVVYANTRSMDDTSVLRHIVWRGAEPAMSSLVTADDLFPMDSDIHRLHIKRQSQQHVLLNWYSHDDGSGEDYCAQYNGNCNVVDLKDDTGFIPLQSLAELQKGSLDNIVVNAIAHGNQEDRPIDLQFMADDSSGEIPVSGIVKWIMPRRHEQSMPIDCEPTEDYTNELDFAGDVDSTEFDSTAPSGVVTKAEGDDWDPCEPPVYFEEECQEVFTDIDPLDPTQPVIDEQAIDQLLEQLDTTAIVAEIPASVPPAEQSFDVDYSSCVEPAEDVLYDENKAVDNTDESFRAMDSDFVIGESQWKVIKVDDIEMIEIELPFSVRHRIDFDDVASMLLIEEGGYVRRGARLGSQSVDEETSYSEAAFNTLQPVIEKYISQQ